MSKIIEIDQTWTLFLDRDGVINHQKEGGYILNWSEFKFYEGVTAAMKQFSQQFGKIFIVTNQKGVGKGVMTEEDLKIIHQNMLHHIQIAGGRIDAFYYCIDTSTDSPCRKPNAGMALQARIDFSTIEFNKSIMVGNSLSDMEFGRNFGSTNVFLNTTNFEVDSSDKRVDFCFNSLIDFANNIK